MTPYKQLLSHDPSAGVWGDCYRTAIGCLLDLPPDEVPHWWDSCWDDTDEDNEARIQAMQQWLGGRGYHLIRFYFPNDGLSPSEFMEEMAFRNPGLYYMLSGESPGGVDHVVICLDDKVVHDPSPLSRTPELVGPLTTTTDRSYLVEILVPIDQTMYANSYRLTRKDRTL